MKKKNKGFSLVELLVVLSIFVIMTALILSRQNKYSSDSEITDLAYKMALSIREAQVYGLSVKANTTGAINTSQSSEAIFNGGYGIHFSSAAKTSFVLFNDSNNNDLYDASTDSLVTTYSLDKGIAMSNLCVDDGSYNSSESCANSGNKQFDTLDVVFVRPNPKSNINAYFSATPGNPLSTNSRAVITIVSPLADKKTKCVIVTAAGQITVKDPVNSGTPASPVYLCE